MRVLPRLGEDVPEDPGHLVELCLSCNEGRRDLNHRIATIVRPADLPPLEQARRQEAPQEGLALLVGERLACLLVLDELECVEVTGPAQVADDRQVEQLAE